MTTMKRAAKEFLSNRRIAVVGVSRDEDGSHGGNPVYRRLRECGYEVFAVNPNAQTVEGDVCYPNLSAIPGGVDAVVVATRPEVAEEIVKECEEAGIRQVWMHRGPGQGSVSKRAVALGRQAGMTVIAGGCPLMFEPTADRGHKAMRVVLTFAGRVPRSV